jgi:hypothetical protein
MSSSTEGRKKCSFTHSTTALEGVGGQHHARTTLPSPARVPIVQEAGRALGYEKLAPPGFERQTVHPVASRYTDYPIPAPSNRGTA